MSKCATNNNFISSFFFLLHTLFFFFIPHNSSEAFKGSRILTILKTKKIILRRLCTRALYRQLCILYSYCHIGIKMWNIYGIYEKKKWLKMYSHCFQIARKNKKKKMSYQIDIFCCCLNNGLGESYFGTGAPTRDHWKAITVFLYDFPTVPYSAREWG